jgi:hypothetical protein
VNIVDARVGNGCARSHTDNLCTSRECKVFFMCKKAEIDHQVALDKFQRLHSGFGQIGFAHSGAVCPIAPALTTARAVN